VGFRRALSADEVPRAGTYNRTRGIIQQNKGDFTRTMARDAIHK